MKINKAPPIAPIIYRLTIHQNAVYVNEQNTNLHLISSISQVLDDPIHWHKLHFDLKLEIIAIDARLVSSNKV